MGSTRKIVADILRSAGAGTMSGALASRVSGAAGMLLTAASLSWAPQALAQTASSGDQSQGQSLEEVTVTGSRIKRTTDFTTAAPTTVLDATTIENLGIVNVGDSLNVSPSNISNVTPQTTGNSAFNTGAYIADLRGLNPFFGSLPVDDPE